VDVAKKFAGKRPLPFHYYYANKASFSYPTSRDSPKPQPACGVHRPQLLLSETAVHHPNHSPSPKTTKTNPRHNCENLRQNQIAGRRTGASVPQRKVGRICGSCQSLHRQACSNFCPPPSKPTAFASQARLLRDVSSFAGTARKGRAQTCRSTERLPAD
jgi:hypothetical protein